MREVRGHETSNIAAQQENKFQRKKDQAENECRVTHIHTRDVY